MVFDCQLLAGHVRGRVVFSRRLSARLLLFVCRLCTAGRSAGGENKQKGRDVDPSESRGQSLVTQKRKIPARLRRAGNSFLLIKEVFERNVLSKYSFFFISALKLLNSREVAGWPSLSLLVTPFPAL